MHAWSPRDQPVVRFGWVLAILGVGAGCATLHLGAQTAPADLPAFVQVDEGFFRGGQPTTQGLEQLSQRGVKTIINLRHGSREMDEERRTAQRLGMRWVNLPMWFWWRPSQRQVREFLSIVNDPANRPVFAHCRQGCNRVGIMTAIYRVVHDGWSPDRAYAEGRRLGLVPWNFVSRRLLFREVPRQFLTQPSSSQHAGRHPAA